MAAPFYSQADQAIYQSGDKFIPQEQYRLNYTPLGGTLPPSIANASTGITGTQAANPYLYPQGGGGGGGGFSGNKYGLDLSAEKTIDSGKWTGSEYEKTGRRVAQDEAGNWKDVKTGQNVYHGNIDAQGLIGTLMNKAMGKETKPGFPAVGSWTGAEWDEDFDPTVADKRLNMIQRWKAQKAFKAEQEQKAAADQARADVAAAKPSLRAQSEANRAANTGGWQSGMAKDEGFMSGSGTSDDMASFAQGGRIGYQGGEFVEDINVEGPGFDENVMMASDDVNDRILESLYEEHYDRLKGLGHDDEAIHEIIMGMLEDMSTQAPDSEEQGIASLV